MRACMGQGSERTLSKLSGVTVVQPNPASQGAVVIGVPPYQPMIPKSESRTMIPKGYAQQSGKVLSGMLGSRSIVGTLFPLRCSAWKESRHNFGWLLHLVRFSGIRFALFK